MSRSRPTSPAASQNPADPGRSRVVKQRDERRTEILDIAERLFYEQGYDRTPVRAIIDAIGIAKGTFYHHFPSKTDLLDALVRRLAERAYALATPTLRDDSLDATSKFHGIFGRIAAWKLDNKALFIRLMKALYTDENTVMRHKVQRASLRMFSPIIVQVVQQGIDEGIFRCTSPDVVVRLMFSMSNDIGEMLVQQLLSESAVDPAEIRRQLDAYNAAVTRLLGAADGTIELYRWDQIGPWFAAQEKKP